MGVSARLAKQAVADAFGHSIDDIEELWHGLEPPYLPLFDWLEGRIAAAMAGGIAPDAIIADPGIGFGKGLDHNLALLKGLSLLHGLGVPILRFEDVSRRVPS